MKQICDPLQCTGCGACAVSCPVGCIALKEDAQGFLMPMIDHTRCIDCRKCVQVCPENTDHAASAYEAVYAAYAIEPSVRKRSSSGGIFSMIALNTLSKGGVVFGAALSGDGSVLKHQKAEDETELAALLKSKYIQSDTADTFLQVRNCLEDERPVLYAGTPCQIAGLKSYLRAQAVDQPPLYVDLVCHGVPSGIVWRRYLKESLAKQHLTGSNETFIDFRMRQKGARDYRLKICNRSKPSGMDPYLRSYNAGLFLRSSCYACPYKHRRYASDITLGDFWGVWHVLPAWKQQTGCSMVITHTPKGEEALRQIASGICLQPVDPASAYKCNSAVIKPAALHPKRSRFLNVIAELSANDPGDHDPAVTRLLKRAVPVAWKDVIRSIIS